jgi:hypothetical protein
MRYRKHNSFATSIKNADYSDRLLGFGQLSRLRAGGLPKAGDDIPRFLE